MDVTLVDQVVSGDGTVLQELTPSYRWDITEEPLIKQYAGNVPTGEVNTVEPWVIESKLPLGYN